MSFDDFHHSTIFSSTLGFACRFPFFISILLTQMARFNCANFQISIRQLQMALILSHREFRVVLLELSMFRLLLQTRESHSQRHLRSSLLFSSRLFHCMSFGCHDFQLDSRIQSPILFLPSSVHRQFIISSSSSLSLYQFRLTHSFSHFINGAPFSRLSSKILVFQSVFHLQNKSNEKITIMTSKFNKKKPQNMQFRYILSQCT